MGIAYPLIRNSFGQKRWDQIYIFTIALEALSFTIPVLFFQHHYGVWSQEALFSALLWIIGLEGFAKFCYHYPKVFNLAFTVMVLPLAIVSPLGSGMTGTFFALSAIGYSVVVFEGARASYRQSTNLYDTNKRAVRQENKLKDLLFMNSFTILEVNKELDITDASRAPLHPQTHWYLPPKLKTIVQEFQNNNEEQFSFELRVRLEKEELWYQFNLRQEDDTTYLVALDIDVRKKVEMELEEQRAMQINNSKLAALGEMAGGIAHEVNNPLTILSGNIFKIKRHLKRDVLDKGDLISSLEKMEMTIGRISKIIIGLRNLSHPGHASLEKTNVEKVIEDTIGLCQEKFISRGVKLTTELDSSETREEIFIKCGHVEVGQVLLNLVNNAFDIIKDQKEKNISIKSYVLSNNAYIEVHDNGPGADEPEKLFNPFYTTKQVGEGTGLGLSLSKKIAESHDGDLTYSRKDDFTVFTLSIPLSSEDHESKDAA